MSVKKKSGGKRSSKNSTPGIVTRSLDPAINEADLPLIEALVNFSIGARPDINPEVLLDTVLASFADPKHSLKKLGELVFTMSFDDSTELQ